MPPKHLDIGHIEVTHTDREAELTRALQIVRFQWHPDNPKVTVLFFDALGDCENIRTVPAQHARYLWAKFIKQGWARKV